MTNSKCAYFPLHRIVVSMTPHPQLAIKRLAIECPYFRRNICHSCAWLDKPYEEQLAEKQQRASKLLKPFASANGITWAEPYASLPENFRNKVKLAVTGSITRPKLGILTDPRTGTGADLQKCPLPTLGIRQALPEIAHFITHAKLQPYNMHTNEGVLKYVIVMESPQGELMIRFVVRRRGAQGAIFKHYSLLKEALPALRVCSINVQPQHTAIIEGEEEIIVSPGAGAKINPWLPMELKLDDFSPAHTLQLAVTPKSFFQTNTSAAEVLYRRAQDWLAGVSSAWDLYCGVGGFALALASNPLSTSRAERNFESESSRSGAAGVKVPGTQVTGVEVSIAAIGAAREAARVNGVAERTRFVAADAYSWVCQQTSKEPLPEAVIVNPPRRGIGKDLAAWLNESGVPNVLYSSCNAQTLARDLADMPAYAITHAQVIDMFAHTSHFETAVLMTRIDAGADY